jgi:hypothetical protein
MLKEFQKLQNFTLTYLRKNYFRFALNLKIYVNDYFLQLNYHEKILLLDIGFVA